MRDAVSTCLPRPAGWGYLSPRMLAVETMPSPVGSRRVAALPLENGEFLHSHEFLRRYARMPLVKKAELIEGVVYMGSPVSVHHGKPDAIIQAWLVTYASRR